MPLKSIRLHPTNKPWMTPNIKAKVKLRQQAFTRGNMSQYNLLCAQVEDMLRKAQSNYYYSFGFNGASVAGLMRVKPCCFFPTIF